MWTSSRKVDEEKGLDIEEITVTKFHQEMLLPKFLTFIYHWWIIFLLAVQSFAIFKVKFENKDKRGEKITAWGLYVAVLILSFSPCILWVCFCITEAVLNSNDKTLG